MTERVTSATSTTSGAGEGMPGAAHGAPQEAGHTARPTTSGIAAVGSSQGGPGAGSEGRQAEGMIGPSGGTSGRPEDGTLTTREIQSLIPHRWPFLLVDRIVEYEPEAKRIVGIKAVTSTEWYFQGHFPGQPVMPGVLQVEALAQTMAVYVARQPGFGETMGLFASIEECRFKRIVVPGDTLRLEVTMERLGRRFGKGRAVATVDGEVACEALLSFIIPPPGTLR